MFRWPPGWDDKWDWNDSYLLSSRSLKTCCQRWCVHTEGGELVRQGLNGGLKTCGIVHKEAKKQRINQIQRKNRKAERCGFSRFLWKWTTNRGRGGRRDITWRQIYQICPPQEVLSHFHPEHGAMVLISYLHPSLASMFFIFRWTKVSGN